MSWWIERTEADGTRTITAIDYSLLHVIFLGGFLATVLLFNQWLAWIPVGLGFLLFLGAKLSLFRRGIWVSWGSSPMAPGARRLYLTGYRLMIGEAAVLVLLHLMTHAIGRHRPTVVPESAPAASRASP
jgi:hypothetical protein